MSAPVKDVLPVDLEEVGAEHPDIVQTFRPSTLTKFELRRLTHTYVLMQNGVNVEVDLYYVIKAPGRGDPNIISTAL